VTVLLKYIL